MILTLLTLLLSPAQNIRVDVDLIQTVVTVTDSDGHYITNLTPEDRRPLVRR